jgi:RND superfamily putative drug exporter
MVLVPATMELLGRANGWLPAWLGRLPRLRVERQAPIPAAGWSVVSGERLDDPG